MSAANPRYYKWYPTVSCDLGTMPFEGDWTESDRIATPTADGLYRIYSYGKDYDTQEWGFGRAVTRKVGHRTMQVFVVGVQVGPVYWDDTQAPVWFIYHGDGVCAVKVPAGEIEPVEV